MPLIKSLDPRIRFGVLVAATLVMNLLGPTQARAGQVTVLVPAYFYPSWNGSAWDQLNAAAGSISIEAIMNPASGPGASQNADYVTAVDKLQDAGGKVIGYVSTSYGGRTFDQVTADILSYLNWYDVDGIFLDEMGDANGALDYAQVYDFIKTLDSNLHVVGNAGIPFPQVEPYVNATDTLVIYEGPLTNTDPFGPSFETYPDQGPYAGIPPWYRNYPAEQFANLVYDVPTAADMRSALDKALRHNAGYVYFTDDLGSNPWDTLPAYWDEEVAAIAGIQAVPEPSTWIMAAAGALIYALRLTHRHLLDRGRLAE